MNKIINIFLDKFYQNLNLLPNSTLVIAFSGGQDSFTLFFILIAIKVQFQFRVYLVYCNHLWSIETFHTQYVLLRLSSNLREEVYSSIPFYSVKTETISRIWRYTIFQRIGFITGTKVLLTGHTKTDQLETFFLNMIRGSGLQGSLFWKRLNYWPKCCCFSEKKKSIYSRFKFICKRDKFSIYSTEIMRPILFLNRYEVSQLAKSALFPIWSDKTNLNFNYSRNRIRHQLLPSFRFYFHSNFDNAINRYLEILHLEILFLQFITNQIFFLTNQYRNLISTNISYSVSIFICIPFMFQKRLIRESLLKLKEKKSFSNFSIIYIIKLILLSSKSKNFNEKPKIFLLSDNLCLILFKNTFYLKKKI